MGSTEYSPYEDEAQRGADLNLNVRFIHPSGIKDFPVYLRSERKRRSARGLDDSLVALIGLLRAVEARATGGETVGAPPVEDLGGRSAAPANHETRLRALHSRGDLTDEELNQALQKIGVY